MAIQAEFVEALFKYVARRESGMPITIVASVASCTKAEIRKMENGDELVDLFYRHLPGDCWGNQEAVAEWSKLKAVDRSRLNAFEDWLVSNGYIALAASLGPRAPIGYAPRPPVPALDSSPAALGPGVVVVKPNEG